MRILILLICCVFTTMIQSQILQVGDIGNYPKSMVSFSVVNGDTTVFIQNYTCIITSEKKFSSVKEREKWDKLKFDVKKAYPYAVLAKMKLAEMDAQLALVDGERNRKDFTTKCEKELVSQFSSDMKNLTYSQGKILFKLLDRETGSTTYQIIKERRGSFSAFMWQGVASIFGNNLNQGYDPYGDDEKIEEVVQLIELGLI